MSHLHFPLCQLQVAPHVHLELTGGAERSSLLETEMNVYERVNNKLPWRHNIKKTFLPVQPFSSLVFFTLSTNCKLFPIQEENQAV